MLRNTTLNFTMNEACWKTLTVNRQNGILLKDKNKTLSGFGAHRPYYPPHYEAYERLGSAGLKHFQIDATFADDIYHPELLFWIGPDEFNTSAMEKHLTNATKHFPDAYLSLRLYAGAPQWWCEQNLDECQVYADGSKLKDINKIGSILLPSVASEKWKKDINNALSVFINWLESGGWSKKVFCLFITYGITWEWAMLGTEYLPDYSYSAQNYFKSYCKNKYATTEALSKAWGKTINFDDVVIPSAEKRLLSSRNGLRTLPESQDVVDHQQSISEMNADLLISLLQTTKNKVGDKVLIGTWYGYTLTAREHSSFTSKFGAGGFFGGHHSMDKVLDCGLIDIMGSPFNYIDRDLDEGLFFEHVALRSIQNRGILFYDENDNYTFLNTLEDERNSTIDVGYTATREETLRSLRICWASALVRSKTWWLTELTGFFGTFKENFSDSVYLDEIKKLERETPKILENYSSKNECEVLFIIDEKSIAYLSANNKNFKSDVYEASIQWGHVGAPFDIMLLTDVTFEVLKNYKLVIPLYIVSPEGRNKINSLKNIGYAKEKFCKNFKSSFSSEKKQEYRQRLIDLYKYHDVHVYSNNFETVWTSRDMLFINPREKKLINVKFKQKIKGIEYFTQLPFETDDSGYIQWNAHEYNVALFLIQEKTK